jgi:hypothetical protein
MDGAIDMTTPANRRHRTAHGLFACILITACGSQSAYVSSTGETGRDGTEPAELAVDPATVERELSRVLVADGGSSLATFSSNRDLARYLDDIRKKQERRHRSTSKSSSALGGAPAGDAAPSSAPAESGAADESRDADGDGITNVQEAGVDEGGIVKAHGDHLVVLRRGRLFTVRVGDGELVPVSKIEVNPAPGHDSWYDEMLIHGDTIVVVGFSYQVGATELGLFRIDARGNLSRRDTFFLRSNDYYSSRNYASRLLDGKLVFYMPYHLGWGFDASNPNLPGVARWNGERGRADDWDLVIDGSRIHKPVQETSQLVLHTVVTCDLSKPKLRCDAQGILGPWGRSFYVSQNAVYVWTHEGHWSSRGTEDGAVPGAVYRLPLRKGGKVGALRVWGAPVDQFSFKESADGHLNVLVRADGGGDAMWSPERSAGDIGMLRVPVQAFDRGISTVTAEAFVDLPEPDRNEAYAFQNRFVGDYLLYGSGSGWWHAADNSNGAVFAHRFSSGSNDARKIALPHGVDRIEALGSDAIVVGTDGQNLHFTSVELGQRPAVAGAYVQRNASQGELRSHGFFYKASSPDAGVLGLPVRRASEPGHAHLVHGSAEILFLGVRDLALRELGALGSSAAAGTDDRCVTSCVDWYGNARPIFHRDRVFALLGYELVEGRVDDRTIRETRRIDMLDLVRAPSRGRPIWKAK